MKMQFIKILLLSLCAVVQTSVFALDDTVTTKISSGLFNLQGQSQIVGNADSKLISTPFMVSWSYKRFNTLVTTSYLYQDSGQQNSAQGIGDTSLTLSYDLTKSPWLSLKLKEKFATGDETQGLSTGENDTSIQLDYFSSLGKRASIFSSIGYKLVGKVAGANMQDAGYASIGAGYIFSSRLNLGLSIDYRESSFKTLSNQTGASFFISQPLTSQLNVAGFTAYDSTKSTSLGITFTYKL